MNKSTLYQTIAVSSGFLAYSLGFIQMNILKPLECFYIGTICILLAILRNSLGRRTGKKIQVSIMDSCIQDESVGWFRNPETDKIFCSKCWYDNETVTPLIKDKSVLSGWVCPKCSKTYTVTPLIENLLYL